MVCYLLDAVKAGNIDWNAVLALTEPDLQCLKPSNDQTWTLDTLKFVLMQKDSSNSNNVVSTGTETTTLPDAVSIIGSGDQRHSQEYVNQIYEMWEDVLEEGQTYPQNGPADRKSFLDYYFSHQVFVLVQKDLHQVLASVYVKPNFPGRSGHLCNGGFLVNKNCRAKGIGSLLAVMFERGARALGYKGSFFNLVYASNVASVRLWERSGFKRTGMVPRAANLKEIGWVDAYQYYKSFEDD